MTIPNDGQCYNVVAGMDRVVFADCPNQESALAWAQANVTNFGEPLSVVQVSSTVIQVVSAQVTQLTQTAAEARAAQ